VGIVPVADAYHHAGVVSMKLPKGVLGLDTTAAP
jgi:hypothetical protein